MIVPILVGVAVYYYLDNRQDFSKKNGKSLEEILTERFIKGEIDEATYNHMKEILKQ